MRKIAFYALFLITLISCSPYCHQWKLAVIKANCPYAIYTKAYLPTCNTFNGLEVTLISCNGSVRLYFNALTLMFPCIDGDESHTKVNLNIQGQPYSFIAERLEGGQSLLIPEEQMQLIVGALLEKQCVEIIVGRYQSTLIHTNFEKSYRQLTGV